MIVAVGCHGDCKVITASEAGLVENASAIDPEWLAGVETIGLSSGASVPDVLVSEVLDWLAERGFDEVQEVTHTQERLMFALPQALRRELRSAGQER